MHAVKTARELHDNESEIISGESELRSVNFDVTVSASGVRRLFE